MLYGNIFVYCSPLFALYGLYGTLNFPHPYFFTIRRCAIVVLFCNGPNMWRLYHSSWRSSDDRDGDIMKPLRYSGPESRYLLTKIWIETFLISLCESNMLCLVVSGSHVMGRVPEPPAPLSGSQYTVRKWKSSPFWIYPPLLKILITPIFASFFAGKKLPNRCFYVTFFIFTHAPNCRGS